MGPFSCTNIQLTTYVTEEKHIRQESLGFVNIYELARVADIIYGRITNQSARMDRLISAFIAC